ncbi:MAG: hypothetical protein H8E91_03320 [Planctomycetes bacterium]|nr:hypothetical protein [Planctomycetota bacterium]
MRFLMRSLVLVPLLLCSVLFSAPDSTKYAHAKILGKLLYTDMSVSWDEQPVSDVLHQFQRDLDIDMFVFWKSKDKDGIDKNTSITLKLTNQPAVVVLERIIEKLNNAAPTAWQLRDSMLEIGFKEQFTNGSAMELRTYDVMNLLFTIRDFDNAPIMGTTGGGGVNFGGPANDPDRLTKDEEVEKLISTITDFVESEQWKVHGGNCTIRFYKGSLLVKAPDFVHRQLGGYSFSPLRPKNMKTRTINFSGGNTSVRLPRVPNIH